MISGPLKFTKLFTSSPDSSLDVLELAALVLIGVWTFVLRGDERDDSVIMFLEPLKALEMENGQKLKSFSLGFCEALSNSWPFMPIHGHSISLRATLKRLVMLPPLLFCKVPSPTRQGRVKLLGAVPGAALPRWASHLMMLKTRSWLVVEPPL